MTPFGFSPARDKISAEIKLVTAQLWLLEVSVSKSIGLHC